MPFAIGTLGIISFTVYWSYRGFQSLRFVDQYTFSPMHILGNKQHYRLISSGFLHINWIHLIFNMFSLYSFGVDIEMVFGLGEFLLIYLGSIVGGNLLSLYLHRHHDYRAIGASGGVCGIIFASIFLFPGGSMIIFPLPIPIPSWLYAILFILVSFFGMRNQWGRIGHDAHLGGAIIGLLITTVLRPSIVLRSPVLYVVIMGISVSLFFYLYKDPRHVPISIFFRRAYWQSRWLDFQARKRATQEKSDNETLNRLLDKISRSGMESLTASETRQLEAISKRMRESRRIH
ncbi:MAG: rhomboid family intramembrane serine protease [Chloroflexi bacterium]|nr:rhomboid family intramembrane serine protease [Chloroflexota bacterium]